LATSGGRVAGVAVGRFCDALRQDEEIHAGRPDDCRDGRDAGCALFPARIGLRRSAITSLLRDTLAAAVDTSLPIWQIHSELIAHLTTGDRLVLVAPTGSGKTTQAPQMLLDAGLAGNKRVVVLQPRRVAARTVAARVAWE